MLIVSENISPVTGRNMLTHQLILVFRKMPFQTKRTPKITCAPRVSFYIHLRETRWLIIITFYTKQLNASSHGNEYLYLFFFKYKFKFFILRNSKEPFMVFLLQKITPFSRAILLPATVKYKIIWEFQINLHVLVSAEYIYTESIYFIIIKI